jgi:hypothetical protein
MIMKKMTMRVIVFMIIQICHYHLKRMFLKPFDVHQRYVSGMTMPIDISEKVYTIAQYVALRCAPSIKREN